MEVLTSYRFTGKIVLWKSQEQYGFLRSEQIQADVFFSHFHCQGLGNSKAEEDLWGKFAQFQIEDIGRKSVEGRQVVVMESDPGPSFLTGVLTKWVKTGCLIRVASSPELDHNRIFAPHSQCSALNMKVPSSNVAVRFKIHMDKFHRVEAKEVTLAGLQEVADCTKISTTADCGSEVQSQCAVMHQDFTNEIMSKDLIKDIGRKNSESLANFFESNVKLHFKEFVHQRVAAKIVMAVICRVAQTGGGKLEEKICRMMKADFLNITSTKQGCAVVQKALGQFSKKSKVLLAEQLAEVGEVEDCGHTAPRSSSPCWSSWRTAASPPWACLSSAATRSSPVTSTTTNPSELSSAASSTLKSSQTFSKRWTSSSCPATDSDITSPLPCWSVSPRT